MPLLLFRLGPGLARKDQQEQSLRAPEQVSADLAHRALRAEWLIHGPGSHLRCWGLHTSSRPFTEHSCLGHERGLSRDAKRVTWEKDVQVGVTRCFVGSQSVSCVHTWPGGKGGYGTWREASMEPLPWSHVIPAGAPAQRPAFLIPLSTVSARAC